MRSLRSAEKIAKKQEKGTYAAYCESCAKLLGTYKTAAMKFKAEAQHRATVHGVKHHHLADATYHHGGFAKTQGDISGVKRLKLI